MAFLWELFFGAFFLFLGCFPSPFGGPLVRVLSSLSGLFASQCVFIFLVRGPWRGIESDQPRLRALPSLGGFGGGGAEPVALLAPFSTCLCFLIEGRKGTLGAIGGATCFTFPFTSLAFIGCPWVFFLRPECCCPAMGTVCAATLPEFVNTLPFPWFGATEVC